MSSTSKTEEPGSPSNTNKGLTPDQLNALFDILTHHETYAEIESFKDPSTITKYGYPFVSQTSIPSTLPSEVGSRSRSRSPLPSATASKPSTRASSPLPPASTGPKTSIDNAEKETGTSPVLQTLFTRFVLPLPWLRDLPGDFWSVRMQGLLERLAGAELSESYDKGTLGLRKTLATGTSAVVEMVGRGVLGGLEKTSDKEDGKDKKKKDKSGVEKDEEYNFEKAEDLERAWDDFVQQLVHGDLVPEMFEHMRKTDDLEGYSPTMKATADYTILHIATFVHHIFITSPEGVYLLQLLRNVHNLIPYKMVKQTLRIGNAATMINGMLRLLLAKMSVGGITNWIGLTSNADDGMNLLQRIISLVLSWDSDVFKKSAEKVARGEKGEVGDDVLGGLKEFVEKEERMKHEAVRETSRTSAQSIITAALNATDSDLTANLNGTTHPLALEYYSALLSIHDREALTDVLCKSQPDLFTSIVREIVAAYEPFIRQLHQGVDLREYLEAAQVFIDEFIKVGEKKDASVGEYVDLLRKNKGLMYRWVHAVAANCEEVWSELERWCKDVVVKFQKKGDTETKLKGLFDSLSDEKRSALTEALDAHAKYLSTLSTTSRKNMQSLLTSKSATQAGPGIYLSRWQHLLDTTPITPELPVGPVRSGKDVKHTLAMGKGSIVAGKEGEKPEKVDDLSKQDESAETEETAPDVRVVVKELGEAFVEILRDVGGPDF